MKAIIYFGDGEESRLNALCPPAGLIRLLGRELVSYTLDRLEKLGIEEIFLCCTRYDREVRAFAETSGSSLSLTLCDPEELPNQQGDLLLLGAEYYFSSELTELPSSDAPAVLTCSEPVSSDTEGDFAGAVFLPQTSQIKPCETLQETLRSLPDNVKRVKTVKSFRLTDVQSMLELQSYLLNNDKHSGFTSIGERVYSLSGRPSGATILPPVLIGRDVTVAPGSVIGPCTVIDDNALIERRAVITGSYVGQGAVIGAHSELAHSAVFGGASVGSSVHLGENSALGQEACLSSESTLCAGVSVFEGCSAAEGAYLCEDVTSGSAAAAVIDDEGSCTFSSRTAPVSLIRFGAALASALPKGSTAVVCRSSLPESETFADCLRIGLVSGGCHVMTLSEGSKQLLAFTLSRCKLPFGCYVSGGTAESVTLMSRGGLPVTEQFRIAAERAYKGISLRTAALSDYRRSASLSGMRELYADWLRRVVEGSEQRLSASVRCPNKLVQQLGDEVFASHADSVGEKLIFNISHDGSSCSAYSHDLGYVMHERLALLVMKNCFECDIPVSVPIEFPAAAESLADEEGGMLLRYFSDSDGDHDREARECAASLDNLFIRDGLALAAFVTMTVAKRGKSFDEVISEIPRFYCSQRFIGVRNGKAVTPESIGAKAAGSGAEIVREGGRAVVRPVRGSRGFMIFSEGASSEIASSLCDELAARVQELSNKRDS